MNVIEVNNSLVELKKLVSGGADKTSDAWCEKYHAEFEKLRIASGMVELDHADFGPLDYFASLMLQHSEGTELRWFAQTPEKKQFYREQAINAIASWADKELRDLAAKNRGGGLVTG